MSDIVKLISDYQNDVKYLVGRLLEKYPCENILSALRSGNVPRDGSLDEDIIFHFHGGGCCFAFGPKVVDVEFGPEGRSDGFDAWRLWQYSKTSPTFLGITHPTIEYELQQLLSEGALIKLKQWPSHQLYYSV